MLSQCARFLLSTEEAADLIAQLKEAVRSTWYAAARGEGITERHCELIAGAFVHESSDLPLPPAIRGGATGRLATGVETTTHKPNRAAFFHERG
ncbi:MAG: hypothetical protein BGO82_11265 [Devosia sp. 67-54]|nr:MAG: hypothetical protein BGO82_11265 [Devosia sp. 67-54]